MDSKIPVIVYVYPQGARAASAGSIILLASHVAAMAPGTNAGAAHPVSIGKDEKPDKVMMKKVVQDAEAYAKSIAKKRGRNVDWAGKAVTQSVSATADDALRMHVIDLVAATVDDLLMKIDGKTVEVGDKKVTLKTKGAKPKELEMSFKYRFLSTISDPNVAYILMMLGFYGILFEIYSPGAIFPWCHRRYLHHPCLLFVFSHTDQLCRPGPDPAGHNLLYSGDKSGEPWCLESRRGYFAHSRVCHADRSAVRMVVHLVDVDSGRCCSDCAILRRCAIICNQEPSSPRSGQGSRGSSERKVSQEPMSRKRGRSTCMVSCGMRRVRNR